MRVYPFMLMVVATTTFSTALRAQEPFDAVTLETLRTVPAEQHLADSTLRVVNIYRNEALILSEMAGRPSDEIVDRLTQEVYAPHASFWNGYLGSEANFRRWSAESLLDSSHVIYDRLAPLSAVPLDSLFEDAASWLVSQTGRRPQGTWYLIFGPGWTDMGGMSGGAMVVDFTRMKPNAAAIASILPHEVTHQVHGPALAHVGDPKAGTVLHRIISEGFATYVAIVHAAGTRTPAEALGYDDEMWAWALVHEAELWESALPLLNSTERADIDRVASHSAQLMENGPTAAGYFLGLRIVQAYVAQHGEESWKELFDLPVGEVLARSEYSL